MSTTPMLSIVVPIYSEEDVISEFYARLKATLDGLAPRMRHEIIFVNDGSTDGSLAILRGLAEQDATVRVLGLSRNFGHQIAITAGLDDSRGDAVVVIDGDLQDPPELIAQMVGLWHDGFRVIYGERSVRKGESAFKRATARLFYRLLNSLSETPLPLDAGDFRLMDRVVVDALSGMREEARYIRGMVAWLGYKQTSLVYERDPRYAGHTKYTLNKMIGLATNGVLSFSAKPLYVSAQLGMLVTTASFLYAAWLVVEKIVNPTAATPGWTSVLVAILFLGGVQLISIGVLGAYIGRIFAETKARPLYLLEGRWGASELQGERRLDDDGQAEAV